jgi:uncharacterized protein
VPIYKSCATMDLTPIDPHIEGSIHSTGKFADMDKTTQTELEAAAFRRLLAHLNTRSDVQNIDLMNLAGFCRNCLSNWMQEEATAKGLAMTKDEARQHVYGMPYADWQAKHQKAASGESLKAFEASKPVHK